MPSRTSIFVFFAAIFVSFPTLSLANQNSDAVQIIGSCDSLITKQAIESVLVSGTVSIAPFLEFAKVLGNSGASPQWVDGIARFLRQAVEGARGMEPLTEALHAAEKLEQLGTPTNILLCQFHADCEYHPGMSNLSAALYNFRHKDFFSFGDLSQWDSASVGEIAEQIQLQVQEAQRFVADGSPHPIFLKHPSQMNASDTNDPLDAVHTPEGTFLHELLHALDIAVFALWLKANQKRIQQGSTPDEYFRKYTRRAPSEGRLLVSRPFYRIFTESRAYYLTASIRNQTPPLPAPHRSFQAAALGFWAYLSLKAEDSTDPNILTEFGFPDFTREDPQQLLQNPERLAAPLKDLVVGPHNLFSTMKQTIEAAFGPI